MMRSQTVKKRLFIFVACLFLSLLTSCVTANRSSTTTSSSLTVITITPNPGGYVIDDAGTKQFTATGTYSDGSSKDITSQITWGSSDIAVATISSKGLATGRRGGQVNITATLVGITSQVTLFVEIHP
jgi:hypothetical protein